VRGKGGEYASLTFFSRLRGMDKTPKPPKRTSALNGCIKKLNDGGDMVGCCRLVTLVGGLFVVAALVILVSMWLSTTNRLNYHRFSITATEHRVRPYVADAELIEPAPYVFGELSIDLTQLEVRWRLYNVLGSGLPSPVTSLDIRGPLSQSRPDVAPVALALGIGKDSHGRYAGIVDIDAELATHMLRASYLYYVSMSDATGREIVRDSIDKSRTINL